MKRFDAAYAALRERLPRAGGAEARRLRDDRSGHRRALPAARLRGGHGPSPRATRDALARATGEQVAAAVGSDDPRHVRPFSDAFLGALVHDVNLVLGLLGDLDLEPGRVLDAASADDGSLAYGACAVGEGRWTAAWMLLPGAASFREELRLFASDGVRALTFAAPYDPAPARLDSTSSPSSAPAPTATRPSSRTSTTA